MDSKIKETFISLWGKYFDGAELPIAYYYTDDAEQAEAAERSSKHRCVICELKIVRSGGSICFSPEWTGCLGGKRYLGFTTQIRPDFEFFLSCGIPGKLEGERYKKFPELARETFGKMPQFAAPAKFAIFKRWDKLEEPDQPEVVIFFAPPDVLAGLFTLANFDESEPNSVFAPSSAGCASIVQYPYQEGHSKRPRAVLGMFDPSARPCVPPNTLTFSVPMKKFTRMIENMAESFLITPTWDKVKERIGE